MTEKPYAAKSFGGAISKFAKDSRNKTMKQDTKAKPKCIICKNTGKIAYVKVHDLCILIDAYINTAYMNESGGDLILDTTYLSDQDAIDEFVMMTNIPESILHEYDYIVFYQA